ncbi:MAG: DedA family protein [Myxococcales bacterium]|jgi:membrane protein DedA with SNARE-associated domain
MLVWLDTVMRQAGLAGLAALFLASGLEYVVPPFPGDSVTVFGGVYAMRAGVPVAAVFAALMAGSLLGAMIDWVLGRWLGRKLAAAPHEKRYLRLLSREQILLWEERFRRRGAWWLLLNRFLPGVRGPIFLAAGASGISVRRVIVWGGLSSLVWNALLFGAGYAVGGQAERIVELLRGYGRFVWIAAAVAGAMALGRVAVRRTLRARRSLRQTGAQSLSRDAGRGA